MGEEKKDLGSVDLVVISPVAMAQALIEKGVKPEDLEKVLALQERHEANQARKAYHVAMTAFKADPPEITKDKTVSFGQGKTSYKHASLANVTEAINTGLSKHGLSASWQTAQNGSIAVTCKITHVMGHSEETTLSAQADTSGSKNSIQAMGSTISYLSRYTLLCLTGLAAADQDDDGVASEMVCIDEEQLSTILDYIDSKNVDKGKFLEYMGVEEISKIPLPAYNKAIKALEAKK